jgi:NAD(P)-dependent dehydrogenase (short-subunit alcohol dehydrogenase family)
MGDGQVVLITGGGTGIGAAMARAFVARGDKVLLCGRRETPLKALVEELGTGAAYFQADVARPGDAHLAVNAAVNRFTRLDVLVNNAGVFTLKPLTEHEDDDLRQLLEVNVFGPLALIREAVPHLQETGGCVVNVSSTVGQRALANSVPYAATKAAVDHLTRGLAVELGPLGIRVNAVAPGLTRTDMTAALCADEAAVAGVVADTPLGRLGEPEDMARVALFLASPDAGWVTGQVVQAAGGSLVA